MAEEKGTAARGGGIGGDPTEGSPGGAERRSARGGGAPGSGTKTRGVGESAPERAGDGGRIGVLLHREVFALSAALLWGVNYPMVKLVLRDLPEGQFLTIRFVLTAVLLGLHLLRSGEGFRVGRDERGRVLLLGLLGVGAYNVAWTCGIHRTTAGDAALLIAASPIFAGLLGAGSRGERLSVSGWLGTGLGLLGVYALFLGKGPAGGSRTLIGNGLVLAGSVLFALYAVLAKPLLVQHSPMKLTALAMIGGLPVLIPFGLWECPLPAWRPLGAETALRMGYVILLGTVAAYVLWYRGVERVGAVGTVIALYAVPLVSLLAGVPLLGEAIRPTQAIGGALVLAGLILAKWPRRGPLGAPGPQSSSGGSSPEGREALRRSAST
jgi:drug/metabolite transporter (DMT)-like permease